MPKAKVSPLKTEQKQVTLEMVQEYLAAKRERDAAVEKFDNAANAMKQLLEDDQVVIVPGYKVHYALHDVQRVDVKKLQQELPEIAARYNTYTVQHRLSVTAY